MSELMVVALICTMLGFPHIAFLLCWFGLLWLGARLVEPALTEFGDWLRSAAKHDKEAE